MEAGPVDVKELPYEKIRDGILGRVCGPVYARLWGHVRPTDTFVHERVKRRVHDRVSHRVAALTVFAVGGGAFSIFGATERSTRPLSAWFRE